MQVGRSASFNERTNDRGLSFAKVAYKYGLELWCTMMKVVLTGIQTIKF